MTYDDIKSQKNKNIAGFHPLWKMPFWKNERMQDKGI